MTKIERVVTTLSDLAAPRAFAFLLAAAMSVASAPVMPSRPTVRQDQRGEMR